MQIDYVAVLGMVLLDGFLAEHEKDELIQVATDSGLTRGRVIDIHGSYLKAMAEVALEDDVVTPQERGELETVAGALGLTSHDVEAALRSAHDRLSDGRHVAASTMAAVGILLELRDRVVFTGDMVRERSEWEALARAAGLEPGGVTKRTKVVVAADPNSLSGKAAKARYYGIPIITEAAFSHLVQPILEKPLW